MSSFTIASQAMEALKCWGNHPCLVELSSGRNPRSVDADTLRTEILDASRQFAVWGVRPGVPVGLFLENSVDFIVTMLALAHLGAILVFGKLEYRALELGEFFSNADPPLVIAELSHLETLRPFLSGRTVVSRSESGLSLSQAGPPRLQGVDLPDDIASINYTYRGYGYPLGAMVSHQQYLHGARVLQDGLQARCGDSMLYSLPMSHIFSLVGCIMVPILYRITGVIARTIHPRILFEAIGQLGIQHITAVPELYTLMRRAKKESLALASLEVFVCGGSVLADDEFRAIQQTFGIEILHGYGLTEFTPVSRNIRGTGRSGTVGPVCDGLECRIGDGSADQLGEILVRAASPNCSLISIGYYRRDFETRQAWSQGWFHTGDIGRFDGDHLVFTIEKKNTCKVNGVLVDLEEVRRALCLDADIADAVITVASGCLVADVTPARRFDPDVKRRQLRKALQLQLAGYKLPRTINFPF
jgi:long-chain acyl-CoA synthetase